MSVCVEDQQGKWFKGRDTSRPSKRRSVTRCTHVEGLHGGEKVVVVGRERLLGLPSQPLLLVYVGVREARGERMCVCDGLSVCVCV